MQSGTAATFRFSPFKLNLLLLTQLTPVRGEDWIKHVGEQLKPSSGPCPSLPVQSQLDGWRCSQSFYHAFRQSTAGGFRWAHCAQLLFFHSRASRTSRSPVLVPMEALALHLCAADLAGGCHAFLHPPLSVMCVDCGMCDFVRCRTHSRPAQCRLHSANVTDNTVANQSQLLC